MKKALFSITILILTVLLFQTPCPAKQRTIVRKVNDLSHSSTATGTYRALVIGINDYKDPNIPDLDSALNDAKAMAGVLKNRYGFKVEMLIDGKAGGMNIIRALRKISNDAGPDDSILIYYAGDGELDRDYGGKYGWWVPVDAMGGKGKWKKCNLEGG